MKKYASIFMVLLTICFAGVILTTMSDHIDQIIHIDTEDTYAPRQDLLINLNTATAEELMLLPTVGENLANSIVAYRNEHGPFKSVSDVLRVKGIGTETFQLISKFLTVGGLS